MAQAGVPYNSVRIVIKRMSSDVSEILKDTAFAFGPASPEVTLELAVAAVPSEELLAIVEFKQDGAVMFSGSANVRTLSSTIAGAATPVEVAVHYTGPGSTTASLSITPGSGLFSANSSTQFQATALTAANVPVVDVPIFWSVSDPSKAAISESGLLTPTGNRGSIDITATAANGVSATITVQLASAANGLRVVQGAGQAGAPNSQLPVPVIVELVGADGLPAASTGQTVTFTASPGALITPAATTLDGNGRASATMTLGATSGTTYIFTAQAGAFQVQWGGTARPGAPTHFVSSGSTTLSLTAGVIPNPIPTIRVADALENSVSGVGLKITIREGGVDLVPPFTILADSVGTLEVYRIAPTKAGSYTILIETADASLGVPSVTYNVTVSAGAAKKLAFTQQPPATVSSGTTVTVTVTVIDQFGNPVTSANDAVVLAIDPAGTTGWSVTGSGSAVSGVATISATISSASGAKSGVKIQASSGTLSPALSSAFSIP